MDFDDQPVGLVLGRREALAALGTMGAAFLAACAPRVTSTAGEVTSVPATVVPATSLPATAEAVSDALTCVVRPAMTEGPYFVDEKLNRSDIRSDPSDGAVSEGTPLHLIFRISQLSAQACTALAGATVDVWHCDAAGVYSDAQDRSFNTTGKMFLRGNQVTDANGTAEFMTIYPGWYQGRAVHIHFKIRTDPASNQGYEFTSQLFFEDAFSEQVYTQQPYAAKGTNFLRNAQDGIYQGGGSQLLLQPTPEGDGYAAVFDIGMQMA